MQIKALDSWIGTLAGSLLTLLLAGLAFWSLSKWGIPGEPCSFWIVLAWWAVITIYTFVFGNCAFLVIQSIWPGAVEAAMAFSIFWGISAGSAILLAIFFLYPNDDLRQSHAFLASVAGAVLGWLLGMYFSPQGDSEEQEFGKIKAAVAAGASGYTLKGLQDFAFKPENHHYQPYLVLALITTALTAATIYNTRAYGNRRVRITFDSQFADKTDAKKVQLKNKQQMQFRAAVSGPDDTSVRWIVVPDPKTDERFGSFDWSKFTADLNGHTDPIKCQVKAESIGDPKLCDVIDITITS